MSLNYTFFLIDIDRTLWDFDLNSRNAIYKLVERNTILKEAASIRYGASYQQDYYHMYDAINRDLWKKYEKGEIEKESLRWERFHHSFLEIGIDNIPLSKQFADDYLAQMINEKSLIPGAKELLEDIKKSGGKMGVLSNGFKEVQYHKLERSGIRHYFDTVAISEEIGYHKPSPDFFRIALEKLSGVSSNDNPELWKETKRKTIIIGDDIENDIEGGQIFGIDQYFYNPNNKPSPGATFESNQLLFSIINKSSSLF
jgi:putative hydrolase of the HAD superfamily